jgi:hypothetical protein
VCKESTELISSALFAAPCYTQSKSRPWAYVVQDGLSIGNMTSTPAFDGSAHRPGGGLRCLSG